MTKYGTPSPVEEGGERESSQEVRPGSLRSRWTGVHLQLETRQLGTRLLPRPTPGLPPRLMGVRGLNPIRKLNPSRRIDAPNDLVFHQRSLFPTEIGGRPRPGSLSKPESWVSRSVVDRRGYKCLLLSTTWVCLVGRPRGDGPLTRDDGTSFPPSQSDRTSVPDTRPGGPSPCAPDSSLGTTCPGVNLVSVLCPRYWKLF